MRKQHILPEIKSGICSMYNCIAILWLHSWLRRDHFSYSQGQGSHWVRIMDHCGPLNTTLLNWSLSHVLNYVVNIFSMLLDNFENEPALPTHAEKSSADTRCQIHSHIALLRKTFFFQTSQKGEIYTPAWKILMDPGRMRMSICISPLSWTNRRSSLMAEELRGLSWRWKRLWGSWSVMQWRK